MASPCPWETPREWVGLNTKGAAEPTPRGRGAFARGKGEEGDMEGRLQCELQHLEAEERLQLGVRVAVQAGW